MVGIGLEMLKLNVNNNRSLEKSRRPHPPTIISQSGRSSSKVTGPVLQSNACSGNFKCRSVNVYGAVCIYQCRRYKNTANVVARRGAGSV